MEFVLGKHLPVHGAGTPHELKYMRMLNIFSLFHLGFINGGLILFNASTVPVATE